MSKSDVQSHGMLKRYQKGVTYIPMDFWDKIEGNEAAFIQDMKSMIIFDPKIDKEMLIMSLDLIKKYIETQKETTQ
jgi:hypothetical protein